MIVSGERVATFVAKECGVQIVPPYEAIGIEQSGKIVAGVILNMSRALAQTNNPALTYLRSGRIKEWLTDVYALSKGAARHTRD